MNTVLCLLLGCSAEKSADSAESQLQAVEAAAGPDQVVEEQTVIQFDGSESRGVRFEWDFGDGSTAEEMVAEHQYSTPGRYRAILTAWGSDGSRKSDAAQVVVYGTLTQQAAVVSASMIRDAENLWLVYPEAGALISIDTNNQQSTTTEVCESPQHIAMGKVEGTRALGITCFATESSTAQIQFVDPNRPSNVLDTIAVDHNPFGIVSRGDRWWTTLENGELISISDAQITNRVDTGWRNDLRSITLLDDDRVVVPRWRSVETGLIHTYSSELELLSSTQMPIDERGDSDNTTGGIPNLLHEVRPSPDGRRWWVPMMHANIRRGEWRNGEALTHESTVRAVLGEMLPESPLLPDIDRKQFDERGRSTVALPSPLGDRLAVLHPSAQHISLLDGSSLEHLGAIQDAGHMITAMAFDEAGDTLYTWVWLDRRVDAYDVSVPNLASKLWSVDLSQDDPLTASQLRGKQIFHDSHDPRISKANYIACSHCHPDGQHDRQTWDFTDRGEGIRNTTSLLGSGQTGMLHWSGNFDEFQDFELDIREHSGGHGLIDDSVFETTTPLGESLSGESEELDSLAEWIDGLAPPLSLAVNPLALEAFYDAGCQECHQGPMYTDSNTLTPVRHDVGTISEHSGYRIAGDLDGLDTPSLIGLRHSAPYLHDGSAATLETAILAHDLVSVQSLSPAQLELLVELMESL